MYRVGLHTHQIPGAFEPLKLFSQQEQLAADETSKERLEIHYVFLSIKLQ
jgi:hypothetical protein